MRINNNVKFKEKFEKLSINDVEEIAKNEDNELWEILNSKLSDIPDNFKYSFDEEEWEKAKDLGFKYIDFLKKLKDNHKDFDFLISTDNKKILGWMAYSPIKGLVGNIKFGSLTNDVDKRLELLFDCKNQLIKFLNDYLTVMWFACRDNKKVYDYYLKLIDRYRKKGYDAGIQKIDDYEFFYISRANKYIENLKKENSMKEKEIRTVSCMFYPYYASSFVNGDDSGMSDEDIEIGNKFYDMVVEETGCKWVCDINFDNTDFGRPSIDGYTVPRRTKDGVEFLDGDLVEYIFCEN